MRAALALGAVLALAAPPALACSITLESNGTMRPSPDNTMLGSEVNGSTPARLNSLLTLLDGTATIDIAAPTLVQPAPGYNASGQTLQVAYSSAAVLGLFPGVSHGYTNQLTSFQATGVLAGLQLTVTIHNRILNPNGFTPGSYTTRTVVTCHP